LNKETFKNLLVVPWLILQQWLYNLFGTMLLGAFLLWKIEDPLWIMWTLIISVVYSAAAVLVAIFLQYGRVKVVQ